MPKSPPKKTPKKRKKSSGSAARVLVGFLYVVVCAVCLLAGTAAGWLNSSKLIGGPNGVGLGSLLHPEDPSKVFEADSMNLLLLGCDEDRITGGAAITQNKARSDMMMLCHIDFKNSRISGLSIPRDTLVDLPPQYHEHKINAYHAYGGNNLSKMAVERLLPGVKVDRVVTLNFEGFVEMVNTLGGVPVDVEKNMDYDDNAGHLHIHLKKGLQTLNGIDAESYVRFRHSDSDFARNDRQHHFMLAFKDRVVHDPAVLPSVLDSAAKMMSDGLDNRQVVALGMFVKSVPKENMKFSAVPVHDVPHFNERLSPAHLPQLLADYGLISQPRTSSR